MYFLLGNCKFGGSACVYAHDKTYLPSGRWWEDEEKCDLLRHISDSLSRNASSAFMPYTFAYLDDRLAWASAHGVEMEEEYKHSRELAKQEFNDAFMDAWAHKTMNEEVSIRGRGSSRRGGGKGRRGGRGKRGKRFDKYDEFDSEEEERMAMANFGFTVDDVMELAIQGVRPWDDDAWVSNLVSASPPFTAHIIPGLGCSSCAPLALGEGGIRECRHVELMQAFMTLRQMQ